MSLTRQARDQFLEDMLGSYLSHNEYQTVRLLIASPPLMAHEIAQAVLGGQIGDTELTIIRLTLSRLRKRLNAAGWELCSVRQKHFDNRVTYHIQKKEGSNEHSQEAP